MIGQKKLQEKIEKITLDSFPKSLVLQGESGCGKHLICSLIENKFSNCDFVYVKDKISYDFVESAYLIATQTFYVIDGNKISDKEQNVLLKLFEEPPINVRIIILTTTSAKLIPTILGRAVVWSFENYSKDELKEFLGEKDESLLEYVTTPGQLLNLINCNIDEIVKLCDLIIDKINVAAVSNVLSLSNRFKFVNSKKNNETGLDFKVFFMILRKTLVEKIKQNPINIKYIDMYKLTNNTLKVLTLSTINDKMLFENYLLKLKAI